MAYTPTFYVDEREMVASMQDRLIQLDQAIAVLQIIRRETYDLLAECSREAV